MVHSTLADRGGAPQADNGPRDRKSTTHRVEDPTASALVHIDKAEVALQFLNAGMDSRRVPGERGLFEADADVRN